MPAVEIGTNLIVGVGTTLTNYIITDIKTGDANVAMTDVNDENGALVTRVIKQVHAIVTLELIAKSAATPATDFPKGSICAVTGYTSYYVDSASFSRTEDPMKVSVTLVSLGISAIVT